VERMILQRRKTRSGQRRQFSFSPDQVQVKILRRQLLQQKFASLKNSSLGLEPTNLNTDASRLTSRIKDVENLFITFKDA
jgi:hypothetical protein